MRQHRLVKILRSSKQTPQMQYQLGFCFWLLTFDPTIASGLQKCGFAAGVSSFPEKMLIRPADFSHRHFGPLPLLIELARRAVKEKVTRVIVATFRNLLTKAPDVNVGPMLANGTLLPLIQNLAGRKWSDDEVKDDIEWLKDTLQEAKKKMTCVWRIIASVGSNGADDHSRAARGMNTPRSSSLGSCGGPRRTPLTSSGAKTHQSSTTRITHSSSEPLFPSLLIVAL